MSEEAPRWLTAAEAAHMMKTVDKKAAVSLRSSIVTYPLRASGATLQSDRETLQLMADDARASVERIMAVPGMDEELAVRMVDLAPATMEQARAWLPRLRGMEDAAVRAAIVASCGAA